MTQTNQHATTLDHQVGPRGRFTLRQASGVITIRGVEGDHIRVRSLDGDRSLDDMFTIETGSDFVDLRQIEKLGLGLGIRMFGKGDSPELAIEVPHGAKVSIDSASAELSASDLSGEKRFRTASGDLTFDRLAGPLDVQTVSGDVQIDGQAPLDLSAKSVSGDVKVRVPRLRRLEMTTTSGDMWLDAELAGNGPFALRTISGDVTIVGRGGIRIEAQTITGDMSSDLPSKRESMTGRKILIVGKAGPTLGFQSVSGDLHVVQPRDAAPDTIENAPTANGSQPDAGSAADIATPDLDAARLEILKALERGEISVAEATDRLGRLDEVLR